MLRNIIPRKRVKTKQYEIVFDDGYNNGYGFPCDAAGKLYGLQPAAEKNYHWCIEHPEKFVRYNEIVPYVSYYTEPGSGTCVCGNTVILEDVYKGACKCEKCGQWYNIYGQSLIPPEYWEDDD